ncbi:MAG: DUF3854 domain-containing protein [Gemmatales bacterium]
MSHNAHDPILPAAATIAHISEFHLQELRKSGISETEAVRHGMRTINTAVEISTLLNWRNTQGAVKLGSCLCIPYFDIHGNETGYCRIKPGTPGVRKAGKPRKYLGPSRIPTGIYFPLIGADRYLSPGTIFIFTEGEKKAISAALFGFPSIGLGGVATWSIKRDRRVDGTPIGPRLLRPELANLPWKGRHVYIAFDSDRASNPSVLREERELAKALYALGAMVRIIELPAASNGAKQGLDDYLVSHGAEALRKLMLMSVTMQELNAKKHSVANDD